MTGELIVPPRSCTTAREVRVEALQPVMDLSTIARRERVLLKLLAAATTELDDLRVQRQEHARRAAAFLDRAAENLDFAERHGSYDVVRGVSEATDGRSIAAHIRGCLEILATPTARREHARARAELHAVFVELGDEVFAARITKHVGVLALRGEYDRWKAGRA